MVDFIMGEPHIQVAARHWPGQLQTVRLQRNAWLLGGSWRVCARARQVSRHHLEHRKPLGHSRDLFDLLLISFLDSFGSFFWDVSSHSVRSISRFLVLLSEVIVMIIDNDTVQLLLTTANPCIENKFNQLVVYFSSIDLCESVPFGRAMHRRFRTISRGSCDFWIRRTKGCPQERKDVQTQLFFFENYGFIRIPFWNRQSARQEEVDVTLKTIMERSRSNE